MENMEKEDNTIEYNIQNNRDIDESVLQAAKMHYAGGKFNDALRLFKDYTVKHTSADVYVDIGNCYYMMGDYKESIEYWNRAIALDSKNAEAYANLGNLHYKSGQVEKAISFWMIALISKPEDAPTSLNLAIAFNQKMMRFESIKYFEKYLKYSKERTTEEYLKIKQKITHCYNVANEYLTLGVNAQSTGDDKQAAACYFKSLANYPNLSKANLNLGSIFFSDKNMELAIKYWKMASYVDPNYVKIYSNLAISYDMSEQFDYAYCYYYRYMTFVLADKVEYNKVSHRLSKLKVFLAKNPKMADLHLVRAKEHLSKSEFNEAIDEFKNYSIMKPEDAAQYKELITKLETYLNPEFGIIALCFEKGNALINENKYAEAKPYFTRIMNLSSPQTLEFSKAKAKASHCEKA
jgi:tetratricopeptide (TPR) repeat protein